jgi:putative ABC transport system permease protein
MDLWIEAIRTGWHALMTHRLRTGLTASTVALGAAAIACLVSLSSSVFATILSGVEAVGGNRMVFVEPRQPKVAASRPSERRITLEDAAELRARVPGLDDLAYLMSVRNVVLRGPERQTDVDVAVGATYRRYLNQAVAHGRDLPEESSPSREREVLLSEPVARTLFGAPERAVGEETLLWGHRYRVVGVTKDLGLLGFNMGGADKTRVVFLSARTAIQQEGLAPDGYLVMRSNGTVSHDLQIRIANAILLQRHHGVDDFEFFDLKELLSTFEKVFLLLKVVFALIGGVGLMIAGVGIMNVLLASVRQRVGELGVRRAIGASRTDIERQLLVESTLIALAGGILGTSLGLGVTGLAGLVFSESLPGWVTDLSPLAGISALVASVGAGIGFGMVPARRASRLPIIGCLRGQGS